MSQKEEEERNHKKVYEVNGGLLEGGGVVWMQVGRDDVELDHITVTYIMGCKNNYCNLILNPNIQLFKYD